MRWFIGIYTFGLIASSKFCIFDFDETVADHIF